jgi:hypothetical protein
MEEELKDVFLLFVRLIGEENDGYYRYEFMFTDNPDEAWGEGFEYKPCCLVKDLIPSDEYITEVHIVKTKIKFDLIQDNCCFGMQDCMDGIVSVAHENIDGLDEYPENGRLFFMFGESLDDVEEKLAKKNILMIN